MDSIDYGTLFGIDAYEAGQGEKEQEDAGPAAEPGKQEETQEEILQESGGENGGDAGGEEETAGGVAPAPEKDAGTAEKSREQTPEENARFAAARRKAEAGRDAAVKKAREDAKAEAERIINEAFKNSGLTNPYTRKPITSKAEYDEYRKKYYDERRERVMQRSGLSEAEFSEMVASLPEVREAREKAARAEEDAQRARQEQARAAVEEQMKEIAALDPAIKTVEDLPKMQNFSRFYELVKRGNNFIDAYRLATYDQRMQAAAQGARQQAINSAQSRAHMAQTQARGAGAVAVPEDIRSAYRELNPEASDAEIQKHYNRYLKK